MSGYDSSRGRSEPSQPVASLQQRYGGSVPYAADRDRERGWEAGPPVREAWRGERALSPPCSRSRDRPAYDRDRAPPYRSEASYAPREPSPARARPYRMDPYATAADPYASAALAASARVNTHAELEHYSSRAGAAYARSQPSAHSRSPPRDPYPARGGGYGDGLYRVRDREPPAVASVRADSYAGHRAAAPQQPRAYVDPYDAPRPLPAKRSSHGFAGDADGGAAKRVCVAWRQREGRPVPDAARTVSSAPRLSGDAQRRAIQLTQDLAKSWSAEVVFALLAPSLAKEPGAVSLNGIHVTAAFTRLSKLPPSTIAGDTRFVTLLSAVEALLDEMNSRTLANLLYALGQLRATLSDSWMARYWAASKGKLSGCNPQELSNTIYAWAQLGASPPASWMAAFWRASLGQMCHFVPQALSNMLWACGQLNLTPPPDWLDRYWEASERKLASFKEQELSNTLWACGQLNLTPPPYWLERYWIASEGKLASFDAQNFSNTLWACGKLNLPPPPYWLDRFWEASEGKLASFNEQGLSNTLLACGQLNLPPPAGWRERFWKASAKKFASFTEQGLSNTLYACGKLGIPPPAHWIREFWRASLPKLGQFTEQNLANSLYACGLLAIQPEPDWLRRFWEASEGKLHSFNSQNCANSLLAVAILQLWDCPVIGALWTKLVAAVASPSSPDRVLCARQLYEVHLGAQSERPGLLPPPSAEVLDFARDSWRKLANETRDKPSTRLHDSVSECLKKAGIEHVNERWCEQSGHSIDIAIQSGSHRIALEVDGPYHFLMNGQPDGPTRLRDRLLRAHGWRVAVVNYWRWDALRTQHERIAYLKGLLDAAAAPEV